MSIFDLLFIAVFLATLGFVLHSIVLALRGHAKRARAILRSLALVLMAYFAVVIIASIALPQRVLRIGEPICFDDWCIAVSDVSRRGLGKTLTYNVEFQLSSRARRISQRETQLAVYVTDDRGRRFEPNRADSVTPFDTALQPEESTAAKRVFNLPADARHPGLVITHEGGFPIGWFIIGYETWFRKPTIVPLPA